MSPKTPTNGVGRRLVMAAASAWVFDAPQAQGLSSGLIDLPLQPSSGGVLTTNINIDGEPFRAIVDSGSPYLVVPLDDCGSQPPKLSVYGCASVGQFPESGQASTFEQYGALPGSVRWLKGDVSFGELRGDKGELRVRRSMLGGQMVFGGADRAVMSQSGGTLLGLIREVNTAPESTIAADDLRPTALAQLGPTSFRIDAPRRVLTLSRTPLIDRRADAFRLVDPRAYGDGVEHVCSRVDGDEMIINGRTTRVRRPVLCVFDTGLTGVVLSQSLAVELGLREAADESNGALRLDSVDSLRLALRTEQGRRVSLGSSRRESPGLFYAQVVPLDWFRGVGPHVVAIGQCVLGRGVLTVDGPQRRAAWTT